MKKNNKNTKFIIAIELIVIVLVAGIIASNFTGKEEKKTSNNEIKNQNYVTGKMTIEQLCGKNVDNCNKTIGKTSFEGKVVTLHLNVKNGKYIIKADDQEIYNNSETKIDYINMVEDHYLMVHQTHSNGTYQTDFIDRDLQIFFHLISRKTRSYETDMYPVGTDKIIYYDYSCSDEKLRYAAKYEVNVSERANASIIKLETYENDSMPNCV